MSEEVKKKKVVHEKKHVLVVDDSALMLRSVKSMLSAYYEVDMALSAEQAMVMIGKRTPDLILLDYEMPVCDGKVMMQRLRNKENTKDIPVIFLTAVDDAERVKEILYMQPQGYLLKPPNGERLLQMVDEQLC